MRRLARRAAIAALLAALAPMPQASAELLIEITRGGDEPTPLAVVPFTWEARGGAPGGLAAIIGADLWRTGRFAPLPRAQMFSRPGAGKRIFFREWSQLQVDYLVVGTVGSSVDAADELRVRMELHDVHGRQLLQEWELRGTAGRLRDMGHALSDLLYQRLSKARGVFSTRLAYISRIERGGAARYRLIVADADGARGRVLHESPAPLLSPVWAPDGRSLAYVSLERGRAAIFHQALSGGAPQLLLGEGEYSSAPAFSPDGNRLAAAVARGGNIDIQLLSLRQGGKLHRLTRHFAVDTEPAWLPDGRSLLFTSDRGGTPQIYRIGLGGGQPERLSFTGYYNAGAVALPDGSGFLAVHGDSSATAGGQYNIALYHFADKQLRILTGNALDESPTVAPNGIMLMYATRHEGRRVLAIAALDSDFLARLPARAGEVSEPAWSPFVGAWQEGHAK